jgi:hypothetical protein
MAAFEARMPMPPSGQAPTEIRNKGSAFRPGSLSEPGSALTVTYRSAWADQREDSTRASSARLTTPSRSSSVSEPPPGARWRGSRLVAIATKSRHAAQDPLAPC